MRSVPQENSVPCRLCGKSTKMVSYKLCNACWTLNRHVRGNPEMALRILNDLEVEKILRYTSPVDVLMDECPGGGKHEYVAALVGNLHTCGKCGYQKEHIAPRSGKRLTSASTHRRARRTA